LKRFVIRSRRRPVGENSPPIVETFVLAMLDAGMTARPARRDRFRG